MIEDVMKKYELSEETVLKMFSTGIFRRNARNHKMMDVNQEYDSNFIRFNFNKSWIWGSYIQFGDYKIELNLTIFDRPYDRFHIDMLLFYINFDIDSIEYSPEEYTLRLEKFFYNSEEEHFQQSLIEDTIFSYSFYKEMNERFNTIVNEYKKVIL